MSNPNPFYMDKGPLFKNQLYFGLIDLDPIAIGTIQPPINQSECAIAIGKYAGQYNQGECAIAIGTEAGQTDQGMMAIAIGPGAGSDAQSELGMAIGVDAGSQNQSTGAIAIGTEAGQFNQGVDAIAIGTHAGQTNQPSNSIVLNASGVGMASTTQSSALYIHPIRNVPTGASVLMYSPSSKEITHSEVLSINELAVESSERIYQELNPTSGWESVNGYYGLAKDAYPSVSGTYASKAMSDFTSRVSGHRITAIVWTNSVFVAIAGLTTTYYRSSDGITWTPSTLAVNSTWNSACYAASLNRLVIVGLSGTQRIAYSDDEGVTWTYLNTSVSLTNCNNASGNTITCTSTAGLMLGMSISIISGSGSGTGTVTAIDGPTSFTTSALISGLSNTSLGADNNYNSVIYVPELGLFVTNYVTGATGFRIQTSPDGITWTYRNTGTLICNTIAWAPELNLLVAVGNQTWYSSDGITWEIVPSGPTSQYAITWSPQLGIFCCFGYGGTVTNLSRDGLTWSSYPFTGTINRYGVIWIAELGIFVSCGFRISGSSPNQHYISRDGINWTTISGPTGGMTGYNPLVWSPELGLFVYGTYSVAGGADGLKIFSSSLKGRPPTSYNVFDSPFNQIDQLGNWTIQQVLKAGTYTAGSLTPSVAGANLLVISNVAPTKTITNFTGGVANQVLVLVFNDANTIIQSNVNVRLAGAVNFSSSQYDTLQLIFITGSGWLELSRSVNA